METEKRQKQGDLRVRRTCMLLSEAFLRLIEKKPFESLTVQEICDEAMVHRSTFYTHFEDKYDLLITTIVLLQEELEKYSLTSGEYTTPKQLFLSICRNVLTFLKAHKKLYFSGANRGNGAIVQIFHDQVVEAVCEKLNQSDIETATKKIPAEIIAQYYVGALIALAKWWLENETPVSENELIGYIDQMIPDVV